MWKLYFLCAACFTSIDNYSGHRLASAHHAQFEKLCCILTWYNIQLQHSILVQYCSFLLLSVWNIVDLNYIPWCSTGLISWVVCCVQLRINQSSSYSCNCVKNLSSTQMFSLRHLSSNILSVNTRLADRFHNSRSIFLCLGMDTFSGRSIVGSMLAY